MRDFNAVKHSTVHSPLNSSQIDIISDRCSGSIPWNHNGSNPNLSMSSTLNCCPASRKCWIFSTHPWKGTRWCGCMFTFLNELIHASGWLDVRLEVNVFRIVCHIWRLLGQRLGSFVMHHLLLSQWMGCATHALFSGWISFFCQMDGMALFCDVV